MEFSIFPFPIVYEQIINFEMFCTIPLNLDNKIFDYWKTDYLFKF